MSQNANYAITVTNKPRQIEINIANYEQVLNLIFQQLGLI